VSERLRRRPFFAMLLRLSFLTYDPVNYLTGLLGLRVGEFLVANTSGSCLASSRASGPATWWAYRRGVRGGALPGTCRERSAAAWRRAHRWHGAGGFFSGYAVRIEDPTMVDKVLREPKELVLRPLVRGPVRRIHPIAMTAVAAVAGIGAALAAAQGAYGAALLLWALNRVLDGLDGTLARVSGRQSDLGAYLDIVADHLVYAAIVLGLAFAAGTADALGAVAVLLASFYINGATWMYLAALLEKRRAGAAARGELTSITMPGGLIEGAETILFYTLFLLLPGALVPLFWLMAALVFITAGQRLLWARRAL
jgi:phosphatidylglycerophosphate synthase